MLIVIFIHLALLSGYFNSLRYQALKFEVFIKKSIKSLLGISKFLNLIR